MLIGTYLDLFTLKFDSACFNDFGEFVCYLNEKGKNVVFLTADPNVPYFINALVEDVEPGLEVDAVPMIIGTYLDLFTGEFESVCVFDYESFVEHLHEIGKNILLITTDPEVHCFINAVVEDASLEGIDWDEVDSNFESEELS